jgi:hypothetical protein
MKLESWRLGQIELQSQTSQKETRPRCARPVMDVATISALVAAPLLECLIWRFTANNRRHENTPIISDCMLCMSRPLAASTGHGNADP